MKVQYTQPQTITRNNEEALTTGLVIDGELSNYRLVKKENGEYLIEHKDGMTKWEHTNGGGWNHEVLTGGNWIMYGRIFNNGKDAVNQVFEWLKR
jgi:hypothetical protein